MGLVELLVEVRSGISYVLVLPDYASEKNSAFSELGTFCRKLNKIRDIVGKNFFLLIFHSQWQCELNNESR